MKIAIVNDIHVGKDLIHNGKVRASSHLIGDKLEGILSYILQAHSPDLFVNLGDLIRSENREKDKEAYAKLLSLFSRMQTPIIHLWGNHELKKMEQGELEKIWLEQGIDQKSFGSKKIGGFLLIWLGLVLDPEDQKICILPNEQLDWLIKQLEQVECPTLIFSHCALDDHDTTGNFFYEAMENQSKKALFLKNQAAIRNAITSSSHVKAVFQAHLHYFSVKQIRDVPYIICPAMGDNICGPKMYENIPEIYTIITIDENQLKVKTFSREYCFAGYEQSL